MNTKQPKFDRQWIKQRLYASAYSGAIISGTRLIRPLFWEQREAEMDRRWHRDLAKAIRNVSNVKEMKHGY